jgi:transcriptional regulator with GAF, ATPase, and Fis domain
MENSNSDQDRLREMIETVDIANALTEPLTRSIENLLQLAAAAFDSDEASVIVRDDETGDLRFLVAIGEVADKLRGLRIPSGKGIAGFVFSSGQPMAVADVGREAAFYAEVDKHTGYSTQTILATPLRFNGEIIGVLEFVNRIGEPPYTPFTPDEMDKSALYADAISTLVDAHESASLLEALCSKMLDEKAACSPTYLREWLTETRSGSEHRELIELALLVRELSSYGETERKLCREVLESFVRYAKNASENVSYLDF